MVDYKTANTAFTRIYDDAIWGGGSGASSPDATRSYMNLLANFFRQNGVKSVVDVGCGDWQFSRHIDWSGIEYSGFDVVKSVIDKNQFDFSSENIKFSVLADLEEVPEADVVVCKDVLQHLPNEDVQSYLEYFTANYRFAIITNDSSAMKMLSCGEVEVDSKWVNHQIQHGEWRPLQITAPPFNKKSAVLHEWEVAAPTWRWNKQVCLIIGK